MFLSFSLLLSKYRNQSLLHVTISSCISLTVIVTTNEHESIANHVTTDSRVSFEPYVTILHINSITYFVTIVLRVSLTVVVTIPVLWFTQTFFVTTLFHGSFIRGVTIRQYDSLIDCCYYPFLWFISLICYYQIIWFNSRPCYYLLQCFIQILLSLSAIINQSHLLLQSPKVFQLGYCFVN